MSTESPKRVDLSFQREAAPHEPSNCNCGGIVLISLGVLSLLGGAIATWQMYGQLHYWSFAILGGAAVVGISLMILGGLNLGQKPSIELESEKPNPKFDPNPHHKPRKKKANLQAEAAALEQAYQIETLSITTPLGAEVTFTYALADPKVDNSDVVKKVYKVTVTKFSPPPGGKVDYNKNSAEECLNVLIKKDPTTGKDIAFNLFVRYKPLEITPIVRWKVGNENCIGVYTPYETWEQKEEKLRRTIGDRPQEGVVDQYPSQERARILYARFDELKAAHPDEPCDLPKTALVDYSFVKSKYLEKIAEVLTKWKEKKLTPEEERAMGMLVGMAIGDQEGAPYEFLPHADLPYPENPRQEHLTKLGGNRFNLKPGQYTDDTAMALCLADILLSSDKFDGMQVMLAFRAWERFGYNNSSRLAETPTPSIGCGGNVWAAMAEFEMEQKTQEQFKISGPFEDTKCGNDANGNGGLMRLAPAVLAARNTAQAIDFSVRQSKVTHGGNDATACAQLMGHALDALLRAPSHTSPEGMKKILAETIQNGSYGSERVNALARSQSHQQEDWNWKSDRFQFDVKRRFKDVKDEKGNTVVDAQGNRRKVASNYVGSFAMDALAMALHCIWQTNSFDEAIKKAVRHGGDADTVGAITGQLAGAIYGVSGINQDWIDALHQYDEGVVATTAVLLLEKGSKSRSKL